MKVDIDNNGVMIFKEIFGDTILQTAEGNQLAICMRDDTIEMAVIGSDMCFRVDMSTGNIEEI